jgi:hypothetical protein
VVLHPVLIASAASTYAEGPYLTLIMFALLWLSRWTTGRRLFASAAAGALFGLAYLIRPEAFLIVGVFSLCGLAAVMFVRERRPFWLGAVAMAGTFALVASPNVVFLTLSTGQFRIEAKGTLAYQWGQRMNQGMSYAEAANGIGADLSDQGVFMRSNREVIASASYTIREYVAFVVTAAKKNVGPIIRTITSEASFGSAWLLALVILGLLRSVWDRHRALVDGMLLVTAAIFVLVLLTVQALWFRYFISVLGMLLFWAGKGAEELQAWGAGTVAALGGKPRAAQAAGAALKWASILLVLAASLRAIPYESQFAESLNTERRDAGRWLAQQESRRIRVMDGGLQVAYYAGADLIYLPYAESAVALRYIEKKKPDYIVLIGGSPGGLPYAAKWFEQGVPDARAIPVYDRGGVASERIKIFRWDDTRPREPQ